MMPARLKDSSFFGFVSIIVLVLVGNLPAGAQASTNEVHIEPRVAAKRDANAAIDPMLRTNTPPIRRDVDLVLVPVTITDEMGRIVTGLDRDNFQVFQDKERQDIRHFSSEDAPISIGLILDLSGSMASKLDRAREAISAFCNTANPQDEFFLITFSDQPRVAADFTDRVAHIQNKLVLTSPKGHTALLDAIYLGVEQMRQAGHRRRALLIISDGGDNHSRYTEGEVKSMVKEADVLIYAIGIYDTYFGTPEERMGPQLLSDITELTGGRAFTLDNPNDLPDVAEKIGLCAISTCSAIARRRNRTTGDGTKLKSRFIFPAASPALRFARRWAITPLRRSQTSMHTGWVEGIEFYRGGTTP